jgi:hypothetical protein
MGRGHRRIGWRASVLTAKSWRRRCDFSANQSGANIHGTHWRCRWLETGAVLGKADIAGDIQIDLRCRRDGFFLGRRCARKTLFLSCNGLNTLVASAPEAA